MNSVSQKVNQASAIYKVNQFKQYAFSDFDDAVQEKTRKGLAARQDMLTSLGLHTDMSSFINWKVWVTPLPDSIKSLTVLSAPDTS